MERHINSYSSEERREIMAGRLLALVNGRGGSCDVSAYVNRRTPMTFRCASGHEWETQPQTVFSGSWCRQCWNENMAGAHLRRPDGLIQAQNIAYQRGGECLTGTYISSATKMAWRCANGHEWSAALSDIRKGTWCPQCGAGARERLTRHYFEEITGGDFPKCKPAWLLNNRGNRMELDGFNEDLSVAFEHQGEQHYREVDHFNRREETFARRQEDDDKKRKICADHGVSLIEVPYYVGVDDLPNWIRHNLRKVRPSIPLKSDAEISTADYVKSNELEVLRGIANDWGGECLSLVYLGVTEKHSFVCAKGHRWEAVASNIKSGTWCPECKPERIGDGNRKHSIESMSSLASSKGGRFLSQDFMSVNLRYEWECQCGHRWLATPSDVMKGTWCPKCSVDARRGTLEQMHVIAKSRGGLCLSTTYVDSQTKLRWRCAHGHEWEARPDNVKNRHSWCPECARNRVAG